MQPSAKERFMREIKGSSQMDLNKHLVILKQKRQSASSAAPVTKAPAAAEPNLGAAPPSEPEAPVVAAANKEPAADDETVALPLSALVASLTGKGAIAGFDVNNAMSRLAPNRILVMLRDRFTTRAPSTLRPLTLPTRPQTSAPFSFPTLRPAQPFNLPTFGPVQPRNLFSKN